MLFIYAGATKLFGIQQTADLIATKFSIPEAFASYTAPLESATGMPTPQVLAVVVDSLELLAALVIALNFGARFFLFVSVLHVGISTCYLYDFRNQPGHGNAGCWSMS
ncbi:DoxX family membrane protein [Bradyrhizobium sp. LMTR 3]|uniref:DoxX family membrane protein n=1 Tax=Bradyrhizobium sp. LMTR 3 TaxID=189873 RepID=UPI001FD95CB6|nr:DoxX family membrane protein [Bradyrhizobium sp. LMTR 3]